ncbi:MAG TPA: serine/threonine-protein kinase, partial [bacterium]|nr:serine/threonine-protein kinase [bacterium]
MFRGALRPIVWVVVGALLALLAAPVLSSLERASYDFRLRARVDHGWPKDFVLVRIDDSAMTKVGRFPWPRAVSARYLDKIKAAGAKTILNDSIATSPTDPANDTAYARSLARVYLGGDYLSRGGQTVPLDAIKPAALPVRTAWRRTLRPDQIIPTYAPFVAAAAGTGIPVFFAEPDGRVRSFPPVIGVHGVGGFPTLATAAWLGQHGLDPKKVVVDARHLVLPDGRSLPLEDGELLLDFVPRGAQPPAISITDLDDPTKADFVHRRLDGKLALLYLDSVSYPDRMPSPLEPATPGGMLLAYCVRTLDSGFAPRRVGPTGILAVLLLAGILAAESLSRRTSGVVGAIAVGAALLVLGVELAAVRFFDVMLPVVEPLTFIFSSAFLLLIDSTRLAEKDRAQLRQLLSAAGVGGPGATGSRSLQDVPSDARREPGAAAAIASTPVSSESQPGALPAEVLASNPGHQLAHPVLIGHYRIERTIGKGGMGAIFLATDTQLERQVAIKVLHQTDKSAFARFRREALAVAKISSPNVVQIYEIGLDAAVPFIVMEYVAGGTLHDLLHEAKTPLHWSRAVRVALHAARGLGAAHAKGIVHRDVKPSNILLPNPNGTGAKIADFGIAKLAGSGGEALTADNVVIGSVGYLSPEQAMSKPVDPRSDVFSLGVTLFRMIAGKMAFTGTVSERLLATVQKPLEDIRRYAPDAPPELAALVARMTAKNPA